MDDMLREFLAETNENLVSLNIELVALEQNPSDDELLASIFRRVHTIKGTSCFLRLPRLEHVAHACENVLSKFRNGDLKPTPRAVTLVFQALDVIKDITRRLGDHGIELTGTDVALITALNAITDGAAGMNSAPPAIMDPRVGSLIPTVRKTDALDRSIRIDHDGLESLTKTVKDLALAKDQILKGMTDEIRAKIKDPLKQFDQMTSRLQIELLQLCEQQIGDAWLILPRIVRDLSLELGKKIDLKLYGSEVTLDRQLLELFKSPFIHMVRNAADHGLESPAERREAGKSETGTITLKASCDGDETIIMVADDGRGLSVDTIKVRAIELGLGQAAEISAMPDAAIIQFIFKPGFSTSKKVTPISGRGVGMDVVKANIEKMGGSLEVSTRAGQGTSFFIKFKARSVASRSTKVSVKGVP